MFLPAAQWLISIRLFTTSAVPVGGFVRRLVIVIISRIVIGACLFVNAVGCLLRRNRKLLVYREGHNIFPLDHFVVYLLCSFGRLLDADALLTDHLGVQAVTVCVLVADSRIRVTSLILHGR